MNKKALKKIQDLIEFNTDVLIKMRADCFQKYPPALHIYNEQAKIVLEAKIRRQEGKIELLESVKAEIKKGG
tara:strand:+ start:1653 stop:1868 length:216 start_codon:yes stop_codon:yes gene_type:complete